MDVGTVLNLDRLTLAVDEPPELGLHIVLRDLDAQNVSLNAIRSCVNLVTGPRLGFWRVHRPPVLGECRIALLKGRERVFIPLRQEVAPSIR